MSIGLMERIPLHFMEECMATMTGTGECPALPCPALPCPTRMLLHCIDSTHAIYDKAANVVTSQA